MLDSWCSVLTSRRNGTNHLEVSHFHGYRLFGYALIVTYLKVFVFKDFYYLELLLLDQTSEQLLIWYIWRGPRVDCGSWIFVVVVVVGTTVGSSSPIWKRVKNMALVHTLHCSLRFQFVFFFICTAGNAHFSVYCGNDRTHSNVFLCITLMITLTNALI